MRESQIISQKTRNISFRIPEDLAESLETEASIKNMNASTLLTQILRHHTGFEGSMGKAGLIAFPRPLLVKLMEGYSDKQAIALAEYISKDTIVDIMSVLEGNYDVESFLRVVESWAKSSNIPFRRETKGQLNTCVVQHDMSKNWSLYLGYLYKYVIEELVQRKVAIDMTDNTVRFRF